MSLITFHNTDILLLDGGVIIPAVQANTRISVGQKRVQERSSPVNIQKDKQTARRVHRVHPFVSSYDVRSQSSTQSNCASLAGGHWILAVIVALCILRVHLII